MPGRTTSIGVALLAPAILAAAIAVAALAATRDAAPTTAVTVHVSEWEFSVVPDSAPAGTVVFTVHNDGVFTHDFSIAGHTTPAIQGGRSATMSVFFATPATHTYFSTVDDWDREMWGAFTVTGSPLTPASTAAGATTTAPPTTATPTSGLPLQKVRDVPLPGAPSRFDYQSVDIGRRRLFIAHLGAGRVISFDLKKQRVAGVVGGVPDVRGVLAVPSLGLLYAAATGAHALMTFDERTLRRKRVAPAGDFPDGIAYDPTTQRVFVSDVSGREETVFRAHTGKRIGSVALQGDPGNVQYDARSKRILVAVGSRNEVASIDPKTLRVVRRVRLRGCDHPHGLEIASAWRRAYVACENNAALIVLDLARMKQTGIVSVGGGPDVLDLDAGLKRLYVASESGVVTVLSVQRGTTRKLGEAVLDEHAHSVAVDPRTHRVYFPLEDVGGRPVL